MAKENNSNIKNTQTAGFYYDAQLSNPLLTATLHTNTYISNLSGNSGDPYESGKPFQWDLWTPSNSDVEDPANGIVKCLEKITNNYSGNVYDRNPSECYREKPLITAILNEDFIVQVGNSWGDAGGGTQLEQAFNSAKNMAALSKELTGGTQKLSDIIGANVDSETPFGKGIRWFNDNVLKKIDAETGADKLNRALITQGSRFSYYGGTQTTFQNLSIRFTIFADWVRDDYTGQTVFKTVHEQLREIYPYAIGKYDPLNTNIKKAAGDLGLGEVAQDVGGAADSTFSTFFGWQSPPAGFQADVRSLDSCQKGTLRLVLGGYYTAENLVIDGMNVNFSKTMTKVPPKVKKSKVTYERWTDDALGWEIEDENRESIWVDNENYGKEFGNFHTLHELYTDDSGDLTPLYADVTITLKPATNYSDNSIINFSSNRGRGQIQQEISTLRNKQLAEEVERKKEKEIDINITKVLNTQAGIKVNTNHSSDLSIPDELPEVPITILKPQEPVVGVENAFIKPGVNLNEGGNWANNSSNDYNPFDYLK